MGTETHLYVHCGWPRTGTSSFQACASEHRERLAEVGVLYPEGWRPRGSDAHYGIVELLEQLAADGAAAIEPLLGYLRANGGQNVLISSEALANWLPAERRPTLIALLLAAREVMPVTCLWTLRRVDRWAASMYLHLIETGRPVPTPSEYFLGWAAGVDDVLAGLWEVGDALEEAVYFPYSDVGAHNGEILRAVGVPDPVRVQLEAGMRGGPRRNRALSWKEAVALLHAEDLSARAGAELSPARLRALFRSGDFEFAGDRPCELVSADVAGTLHAAALKAARDHGMDPYADFFDREEVEPGSPVSLEPDVLSDEDLSRLVACLERPG